MLDARQHQSSQIAPVAQQSIPFLTYQPDVSGETVEQFLCLLVSQWTKITGPGQYRLDQVGCDMPEQQTRIGKFLYLLIVDSDQNGRRRCCSMH